jgi:hypothetical protein
LVAFLSYGNDQVYFKREVLMIASSSEKKSKVHMRFKVRSFDGTINISFVKGAL